MCSKVAAAQARVRRKPELSFWKPELGHGHITVRFLIMHSLTGYGLTGCATNSTLVLAVQNSVVRFSLLIARLLPNRCMPAVKVREFIVELH